MTAVQTADVEVDDVVDRGRYINIGSVLLATPCTFPDRVGKQAMRDCVGPLGIRDDFSCRLGREDYYRSFSPTSPLLY